MYFLGRCSRVSSRLRLPLQNAAKKVVPRPPRSRTWGSGFSTSTPASPPPKRISSWISYPATLLLLSGATWYAYENYQPFRHTVLAVVRCSRVGDAFVKNSFDYKKIMTHSYESEEERKEALSECHRRCAHRVLKALLQNGGIFIKLGQHLSSLVLLPTEWTSTLRPLQDQCLATSYEDLEKLFLSDMGCTIEELFDDFDPNPVGVASLAQVHVGTLKSTKQKVAVKLQHPHLQEFCDIDMEMVEVTLGWVKHLFPEFEFTWLGDEMRQNLPKEMDFVHEAHNAERATKDFENIRTSMYIPKVIEAKKRILIMEYIQGARVDNLQYLADHNIDRNKVSLELARVFAQMVHLNGYFHADPHLGNLLIRPAPKSSRSPYNFEIVLLDHGLYFDLDDTLRLDYSKFWLSLIAPGTPEVRKERRKYASRVGNIGDDLYPVFEAAITGRAALKGSQWDEIYDDDSLEFKREASLSDLSQQSEAELQAIRNAMVEHDGLVVSLFDVLRRVPRRVLMVLKLNDLARNLDNALVTTHDSLRVFLITAKYCTRAVWRDDRTRLVSQMRENGIMSVGLLFHYFTGWLRFEKMYTSLVFTETLLDWQAYAIKMKAWVRGLLRGGGLKGAHEAAAGLL